MNVLILLKTLERPPELASDADFTVTFLDVSRDAAAWLKLHKRAFQDQTPPVRPWTLSDFRREFESSAGMRRPTWLARSERSESAAACGAVSVSMPRTGAHPAGLHWLMVDPQFRRRGIGSLLLATAERYCWERGIRRLRLETHRGWKAAAQFYTRHGYEPVHLGK